MMLRRILLSSFSTSVVTRSHLSDVRGLLSYEPSATGADGAANADAGAPAPDLCEEQFTGGERRGYHTAQSAPRRPRAGGGTGRRSGVGRKGESGGDAFAGILKPFSDMGAGGEVRG